MIFKIDILDLMLLPKNSVPFKGIHYSNVFLFLGSVAVLCLIVCFLVIIFTYFIMSV